MTRTTSISAAAFAIAAVFTGNAFASGEQQDLRTCLSEIQIEAGNEDAVFSFKSMRGASLRRLTFEQQSGEEKNLVVCSVRRGAVVNLDWSAS